MTHQCHEDMPPIDPTADILGMYGLTRWVPTPEPDTIQTGERGRAANSHTACQYLIDAPAYHPVWSQYVVSVIRLVEDPALEPPILKFVGATHELIVMALNPDHRQTPESITDHCRRGDLPFLTPVNIAEQFECTDDEVKTVTWLACRAVCNGLLNPEVSDAPAVIREQWLIACTKTLAHIRGEAHAS